MYSIPNLNSRTVSDICVWDRQDKIWCPVVSIKKSLLSPHCRLVFNVCPFLCYLFWAKVVSEVEGMWGISRVWQGRVCECECVWWGGSGHWSVSAHPKHCSSMVPPNIHKESLVYLHLLLLLVSTCFSSFFFNFFYGLSLFPTHTIQAHTNWLSWTGEYDNYINLN